MNDTPPVSSSAVARFAVFTYGVICYGLGVAALVAWILIMLGVLPFTGGPVELSGPMAMAFNVALTLAFGLQHSVMARRSFKDRWTRLIPPAAERPTYLLATAVFLGGALWLWQPMPTTIWEVETPIVRHTITGVALLGWTYLFLASFAIDHFELFGLQQVYRYFTGKSGPAVPFKQRWMYRFDRHPIMTGALVGMWCTPHMQLDHLLFAGATTVYIVIGVHFEERALRRQWGATYEDYARHVPSLVPTIGGAAGSGTRGSAETT